MWSKVILLFNSEPSIKLEWPVSPSTTSITTAQPDHPPFIWQKISSKVEFMTASWLWDSKRWKEAPSKWNTLTEPCLWISASWNPWNSCPFKETLLLLHDCSVMLEFNIWNCSEQSQNILQRLQLKTISTVWTILTLSSRKGTVLRMFWKARRFMEF